MWACFFIKEKKPQVIIGPPNSINSHALGDLFENMKLLIMKLMERGIHKYSSPAEFELIVEIK